MAANCGASSSRSSPSTERQLVIAFAMEGDFSTADLASQSFEMEWPPRSHRIQSFPEIDRAEWFTLAHARAKILPAQRSFLDRLETLIENGDAQ